MFAEDAVPSPKPLPLAAADRPRTEPLRDRLLVIDPARGHAHRVVAALPELLRAGDLLVLNDAGTLPASLPASVGGAPAELRLAAALDGHTWQAVLFGPGDWRTPTERRAPPPPTPPGTRLEVAGLGATVVAHHPLHPRLLTLRFDAPPWSLAARRGAPVQYSYMADDVDVEVVRTRYAGRPWSVEMPSAGSPLTVGLLTALRSRGVALAALTHAAGLSATGDDALDAALPLPERSDIPADTVAAVARARARGGRVLAVGTSVVRALEGRVRDAGALVPGEAVTDLRIGPDTRLTVVDGLFTGMHDPTEPHFRLMEAFAPAPVLLRAHAEAAALGYQAHEFGDSALVLQGALG